VVGQQNADVADILQLEYVAMATIFWLSIGLYMSAHWRYLRIYDLTSVCGGDEALCQITLTTCWFTAK